VITKESLDEMKPGKIFFFYYSADYYPSIEHNGVVESKEVDVQNAIAPPEDE
jgi:hypothetical protein